MTSIDDVEVRDRTMGTAKFLDIVEESKNPALHYRWVRVDESMMSHTKHKLLGYRPVKRGEVETVSEPLEKGGEEAIIVGDLQLFCCPKELYERRQAAKREHTQNLMNSTALHAEEEAKKRGVKVIKEADHNKEQQ